ncbi:MAG: molybdopterin-dependent oxidoreductase [Acidobacteria bacterium]|nr:molybdopterin-dependent oxidoreductase [Acidobacteriota bacterium]
MTSQDDRATAKRLIGGKSPRSPKRELQSGNRDTSPATKKDRVAIPSLCWQCVTQDPIIGYLENGRLVKIEGNPAAGSSRGKICAKGQAGINQVYNPDRLLHPIKRTGKRGEGRWQRISWDEALDLLINGGQIAGRAVKGLKTLRDAGTPEKFMFHYGRTVGTDWQILMDYFLKAYGTDTIGDHSSICMRGAQSAQQFTPMRPGQFQFNDVKVIVNFGASLLEATTSHIPVAERTIDALTRGTKLYTFDTRLSLTAAKSTEWFPVKPGTDLAVLLSLCHVILENGTHDKSFLEKSTNVTEAELKAHLAEYSPEWAEAVSGVPAGSIRTLAAELATLKPSTLVSGRGAFMHFNGVQTQRAIIMLDALVNFEFTKITRFPSPAWRSPFPPPQTPTKQLSILTGEPGAFAFGAAGVSHQILHMIDRGPERPDIYMVYCHNPVYANGECLENARVFKDENKIPFLVAVDVGLGETSELADLVLPDATYLERYTLDGRTSLNQVPEYYLRQPMHPPLGEARNFVDVACELAGRLGFDLGFQSAEEFVRRTCDNTPGVREAGGFEYMKRHGIWSDKEVQGVSTDRKMIAIRSEALAAKGFSGIPAWMTPPEHAAMHPSDLILTTYKTGTQTQSRTQNCKWLSELNHENPAHLHPDTAAKRGIRNGDKIRIRSSVGEMVTRVFITEGVHPSAVAVSHHGGHWAQGLYASGRPGPIHAEEPEEQLKWWKENGTHVNLVIPIKGDPIGGAMCWNDAVVQVSKA